MSQLSYKDIGPLLSYEDRYSTNDDYLLRLRRYKVNHKCIPIYLNRYILSNSHNFSNHIELINRLSEQSTEDGTHLYKICTLFLLGRSSQYINTTMSQFSYKDIGALLSYEDRYSTNDD